MKPSFRNLFMKKLTRDRVVPIISASVSWLIFAIIGSSLSSLPKFANSRSSRASRFSLELNSRDRLPVTKNCHVFAPAGAIIHYAAKNELCPDVRIGKLKEKKPEPRALRREDAARLIAAADGKLRLLLAFLFAQGWRISDTLRLQWADIDLRQALVQYHITKTDDRLTMPLHLLVLDLLRREPPGLVGRVFPWRGRSSLYPALQSLCRSCGIVFTPHMARHSFATWLAADGASAKEIMEAGAWKDFRSVMRYTNVDAQRVRVTINRIKL
jgi:integrase